jgi:anionic cell wall polymer biosynthesis LytR-Cps2A-Psr (LCP) family protein
VGFVPDYYILIDFKAFVRMVDAVGGVEINVPYDMVYNDPYQNLAINIPKGNQTLLGEEALHFARYRMGNDRSKTITDYQRIENQQAVIHAMLGKLLRPANIIRIPEFISIFNENIHTDIKLHEMVWFGEQLNEIRLSGNALEAFTLPTTGTSGSPGWYELLDEEAIIELVNRTVNPFLRDIDADDLDIID